MKNQQKLASILIFPQGRGHKYIWKLTKSKRLGVFL